MFKLLRNSSAFKRFQVLGILVTSIFTLTVSLPIKAQVEAPDRRYLFREDSKRVKKQQKSKQVEILKEDAPTNNDFDLSAPIVEVIKESDLIKGSGGAIVSGDGVKAQAEKATVNTKTKDARLEGDVLFSAGDSQIASDTAYVNMDRETGVFNDAQFEYEVEGYRVKTDKLEKLSEFDYSLNESEFTSCNCDEDTLPWSIRAGSAHITENGYAHTYNSTLNLFGVPVLYSPYFLFPVKTERASGLLMPKFGYSSKDGFQTQIPLFLVLDESTDVTLRPFTETKSRTGLGMDFRKAFSRNHNLKSRVVYSDESARGDSLRGSIYNDPNNPGVPVTSLNGLSSPVFDKNRVGVLYNELWRTGSDASIPASFLADGHYVSDDLYLKEMEDSQIGDIQDRYLTSTASLRVTPFDFLNAELRSEYTQFLDTTKDHTQFQRFPELNLSELKSFRPFGFNPLGLKLVTSTKAQAVNFVREDGYQGTRYELNPQLSVPFHFANYLNNNLQVGARYTKYSLSDTTTTSGQELFEDTSPDRSMRNFSYTSSTALEKVYQVPEDSLFRFATSLGSENQGERLARVKHVIEPQIRYNYVPEVDQSKLPIFDGADRIQDKNLVTMSFNNRFYGRFLPNSASDDAIAELAPRVEDLPVINQNTLAGDITTFNDFSGFSSVVQTRQGSVQEIANFGLLEAYDYRNNPADDISPWSDVNAFVGLFPSRDFGLRLSTDYSATRRNVTQWDIATHFKDDRTDTIRLKYKYLENSSSQLEGNFELLATQGIRLGCYARYDLPTKTYLESRAAVRFTGRCDCWGVDVGVLQRTNPDKEVFFLSFTFGALGAISQGFDYRQDDKNDF